MNSECILYHQPLTEGMVCWGNNTDRSFWKHRGHSRCTHLLTPSTQPPTPTAATRVCSHSQQLVCMCASEQRLTASSVNWPSVWNRKLCRITNLSGCWQLSIQVFYLLLQLFYLIFVPFLLPIQFLIMCFALSLWNTQRGGIAMKTHRNIEVL